MTYRRRQTIEIAVISAIYPLLFTAGDIQGWAMGWWHVDFWLMALAYYVLFSVGFFAMYRRLLEDEIEQLKLQLKWRDENRA